MSNLISQDEAVAVDLHANSEKELFYGICSFLMKNGITTGVICSKSKEMLDGLGEYMSSVKIPWVYGDEATPKLGYKLVDKGTDGNTTDYEVLIDPTNDSGIIVRHGNTKIYNIEIHNKNALYEEVKREVATEQQETPIHLKNEQIRKMFLKAFVVAEQEIDIISPWMNFGVVNDNFVNLMEEALARGVKIRILYGLRPDSAEYSISRSNRSDQVARFLRDTFKRYGDQLKIQRDNIHYKLVLCDEKFKLEGGYNYLSFIGNYEDENTRKEGSPFGTRVDEIRYLRKEYFGHYE